ncbi:hypothetical protein SAMN03159488_04919 [Pseudomonas sp. NFIX10]|nr:hypothetical protein SAMN03159488_04919 [Pseudomonas sp. NFIX10]SFF40697.1 hypothetical protein SAMN03159367_04394 [Pseudomonas sp. NFACC06-1]
MSHEYASSRLPPRHRRKRYLSDSASNVLSDKSDDDKYDQSERCTDAERQPRNAECGRGRAPHFFCQSLYLSMQLLNACLMTSMGGHVFFSSEVAGPCLSINSI